MSILLLDFTHRFSVRTNKTASYKVSSEDSPVSGRRSLQWIVYFIVLNMIIRS